MDRVIIETISNPNQSRKRKRQPETWKKSINRRERYVAKQLPEYPKCTHKKGAFKCRLLNMQDIKLFHSGLYRNQTKIEQDNFIIKYCSIKVSKKVKESSKTNRSLTFKYTVLNHKKKMIPVCRQTFLNILNLNKDRVQGVLQRFFKGDGQMPKERRGGDHRSNKNLLKRNAVKSFIESLNISEPHYCRGKSIVRVYLPPELNIKKLWRIYSEPQRNNNPRVKECFFRNIFNTCYNIGFGSPRTDACSTCIELTERLKKETNEQEKNVIITTKRVHKLKARAFYDILREKREGLITMSFDCQKNMPLPKLPDSSAYFSSLVVVD